jgi:multidrug efflux pump subunit AcrA (membrane-fusion protein)
MGIRFRRLAAAGIAVVIVAAGAGTAYAAMSSSGPSYRLASATPAYVTATLPETGTLTPVHQADVGFAADGTVQAVAVKPGQHVTAGQRLGTLDPTSLQAALTAAQSALANANLQVSNDIVSQDTAAAASGTGSAASSGSSPGSSTAPPPSSALRPLQQAVLSAQRKADSALAQARAALAQAKQVCAAAPSPSPAPSPGPISPSPAPSPGPSSPSPASSPGPSSPSPASSPGPASSVPWPSATAPPSPRPTPTAAAGPAAGTGTALAPGTAAVTCLAATQRVLAAEIALLQAQQALSGRLTALAGALVQAVAAKSSSGGGDPASPGGTGGSGGPASAAQLAADQASADAAAAQVTVAQQDLAAATLVSPISGTVVTVSATPGTAETAGSTAFVIAGLDAYEVVTQVPVTYLPQLKTGQRASVLPDGTSTPLSGSVVSIGLIPDSTGSPVTYAVTIGLAGQPSGLRPGSYAGVTITTARSSGVSVPTSAVHRSGHRATVIVYAGGKARVAKVTVGTVGPVMTRITAGLRAGEQVVLANLSQPLPSSNPANQGPGPGGRFFGGQFPAGGSINFVAPPG